MRIDWPLFLSAVGLALLMEGLLYFLLADRLPSMLKYMSEQPPRVLRLMGAFALAIGLGIIALVRHG
ncbi:MAG: DUF2065 domain-containing protein [Desulfovibrionaceae bacterium]